MDGDKTENDMANIGKPKNVTDTIYPISIIIAQSLFKGIKITTWTENSKSTIPV